MWGLLLAAVACAQAVEDPRPEPLLEPEEAAGVEEPVALAPIEGEPLVFDARPALLALDRARHRRTINATLVLAGVAVTELGAGFLLVGGTTSDTEGLALAATGALHGIDVGLQLDANRRLRASFLATAAVREGRGTAAWRELAREARLQAESRARTHALLTGLYVGLAAAGAGLVFTDSASEGALGPGAAAAFGGTVGALHHVVRWRQEVRFSVDVDTLIAGMPPTVIEQSAGF